MMSCQLLTYRLWLAKRGAAYAGMDLQLSAKDCIRLVAWREGGRVEGREGKECTGVRKKHRDTKKKGGHYKEFNEKGGKVKENFRKTELSKFFLYQALVK